MKMSQQGPDEGYVVRACEPGKVTLQIVNRRRPASDGAGPSVQLVSLQSGAIIAGKKLIEDWGPDDIRELSREHLLPLFELQPELVLLGTGANMVMPAMEWVAEFHQLGIGCDVMTTDAACRTYNILSAEGRRVVAAIIIAA